MNKNSSVVLVIVVGLGVAFILVSTLHFFFRKNPVFLSRKLKIGAAIISLTAFVNTSGLAQENLCYNVAPTPPDTTEIKVHRIKFMSGSSEDSYIFTINKKLPLFEGEIFYDDTIALDYRFEIIGMDDAIVAEGQVKISDQTFILKNPGLDIGFYDLIFYRYIGVEREEAYHCYLNVIED